VRLYACNQLGGLGSEGREALNALKQHQESAIQKKSAVPPAAPVRAIERAK
jgi:hypothetical protein